VPVTVDADSVTGTFAVNCVINGGGAVAEVSAIDMFADSLISTIRAISLYAGRISLNAGSSHKSIIKCGFRHKVKSAY